MKFPKEVKVGGFVYKIIYPYIFEERIDRYAFCDNIHKRICIREFDDGGKKIPDQYLKEAFFHELLHAIDDTFNAGEKLSEETTCRISKGLYQVLKDNKLNF